MERCNPAVSAAQRIKKNKYWRINGLPPSRSLMGSEFDVLKSLLRNEVGGNWIANADGWWGGGGNVYWDKYFSTRTQVK